MKKSLKFCKSKTGFTLVELVIVIAIVIILSVISVPIYRGYVDKAKMAEGYALLGTIISAQKAYYSEHGNFLNRFNSSAGAAGYTCYDEVVGIDARGNKYFTWFFVGGYANAGQPKVIFDAFVKIPEEISTNNCSTLAVLYNVTSGSTFSIK